MVERVDKLECGTRYIVPAGIGYGNVSVIGDHLSRFERRRALNPDGFSEDRVPGPRARWIEAFRDQQFIETKPGHRMKPSSI